MKPKIQAYWTDPTMSWFATMTIMTTGTSARRPRPIALLRGGKPKRSRQYASPATNVMTVASTPAPPIAVLTHTPSTRPTAADMAATALFGRFDRLDAAIVITVL
ncbi:hypothetical protein [Frigoribacterium sp. CFBP 13712]|uniref:hypothetical protein n=1 Tax=Frigoribacterium sp. CFBP 13712 TaxID=2775309 RepID=UPI0017862F32|nr:hypothetical protein [Frigoribacterium sp. CFBP 13712]MBD8704980.1 hypothetical protein [Frigoribacterium sp. CFBP 13712]